MKTIYTFSILFCSILLISCGGNGKSGGEDTPNVKNQNKANEIIAYNNALVEYFDNANDVINSVYDYTIPNLEKKMKGQRVYAWTWNAFIGVDKELDSKVGFVSDVVDLKEAKNYSVKLDGFQDNINDLVGRLEQIQPKYNELQAYVANEDYLDDDWAKGKEFITFMDETSEYYVEAKDEVWKQFGPLAEEADLLNLKNHPLKDYLIPAKEAIYYADDIYYFSSQETVSLDSITMIYDALEAKSNEMKELDETTELSWSTFLSDTDDFLGTIRKVKRDGSVTSREQEDLLDAYNYYIDDYNRFVN